MISRDTMASFTAMGDAIGDPSPYPDRMLCNPQR
jgi:hypothetical protein